MNENTNENFLIEVDHSIFGKIKMFFRKLFKSNKQEIINQSNIMQEQEKSNEVVYNNFVNDLKAPEKIVNLRLYEMQKDLESGKIIEEDLCEKELQELKELYLQQIEEKKKSIEIYKNRILKIKTSLS